MRHLTPYLIRANQYLEHAREVATGKKSVDQKPAHSLFTAEGKIQGEYPPFAASLGATILKSGLLPAIFLYAEQSGAGKSKDPLLTLILHMIKGKEEVEENETLKDYVLRMNDTQPDRIRQQVLDASVAAKLALRTYPVEGKTKEINPS